MRATRVILLLVVATLLNVGVAWSCALWSRRSPMDRPGSLLPRPTGRDPRVASYPVYIHLLADGFGVDLDVEMGMASGEPDVRSVARLASGWPRRSMLLDVDTRSEGVEPNTLITTRHDGIDISSLVFWPQRDSFTQSRRLPVRPAPAGFALNTAFYALLIAGAWMLGVRTRAWNRRRAGRCPKCGYDVRGVDACPECGQATTITP